MARKSRLRRFVIATDNHGDMIDPSAYNAFKSFVRSWQPDDRLHLGDAFDFRCLRNGASDEEKQEGLQADRDAGVDFLKWFDPQVWLLGNHDHRIVREAQHSRFQMMAEYCRQIYEQIVDELPSVNIIQWGKRRFYQYHDFKLIHGYHSGLYAAKYAASTYGNVIQGHTHAPMMFQSPHIDGQVGHVSGCLCQLDMEYNSGHPNTLRQAHGWLYGVVGNDGKLCIWHATKSGDEWILPSEMEVH